jgi:outer membrane protein insertion porin family
LSNPVIGGLPPSASPAYIPDATPLTPNPIDQSDSGAIVLGVKIAGNKNVKESEIRRHLKTRKDRAYDPQIVQDDLRRLYSTRKFYNLRTSKQHADGGIYITFQVLERPTIGEVLFIGNKYITDKGLLKASGLKQGDSLNVYTVQEARRKVEELYHYH